MTTRPWYRHTVLALAMCCITVLSVWVRPGWSQNGLPPLRSDETQSWHSGAGSAPAPVAAIAPAQVATAGTAVMSSMLLANGQQQVAIFDHAKQTMVVYHIDPTNGDIRLKSVRRTEFDFALEEFNLSEPTPTTVRKNIGRN